MSKIILDDIRNSPEFPLPIPGAKGGIFIRLLNLDPQDGQTATVNRLEPGAYIPAHFHKNGAETHYVLEGDFIENGQTLGPGAFLTHATNVVHGPHETVGGALILTIQESVVDPNPGGDPDFHIA